jgi:TetR/AcrR family fatty acid metabolism transcriptional regulator
MPVLGKSKKDVLTEFRTAELLEAARRVFAEKGFHEATVDEVAEDAGVAKGTVYLYYRSKRDLYWAALKHGISSMHEETRRRMEGEDTIEGKLHAFIATKINYFEVNRDFFRIYHAEFGDALLHPAHVNGDFAELYLRQARMLEAVLRQAIRRRLVRNIRADSASFMISDLTRGMITQRLMGWSRADVESDIAFVFDLAWKGIAGR